MVFLRLETTPTRSAFMAGLFRPRNCLRPFSLSDLGNGCPVVNENLAGVKGSGSAIDTGCGSAGWLTPKLFQQWTNHDTFPLVEREVEAEFKRVADSAMKFLHSLKQKGRLAGWSKKDKVAGKTLDFHIRLPDSSSCDVAKEGDSTIYHYQLSRASKNSPWKLEKAWRTDKNGDKIEEYPVP
jgi:hypothetical protein